MFDFQRKELGVLVYDCSCLALDLHRVFSLYWGLQYRDFIPSFWSKRLFALFNRDEPLKLMFNSTKAQAYVSVRFRLGGIVSSLRGDSCWVYEDGRADKHVPLVLDVMQ